MSNPLESLSLKTAIEKIWHILNPPEKRRVVVLLGMTIFGVVLDTFGISLIIPAVAMLTDPEFQTNYPQIKPFVKLVGNPTQSVLVVFGLGALVVVYLFKNIFIGLNKFLQMRFQAEVETRLSNRLFNRYLNQPYSFHLHRNSSELIRNLQDAKAVTDYAVAPILILVTEALVLIGLSALLLIIEPIGSAAVVLIIATASFVFHVLTKSLAGKWGSERQFHDGQRLKEATQALGGIKDVKVLNRESIFERRFSNHNDAKVSSDQKFLFLQQLPILWLEILVLFSLTILVAILELQGNSPSEILPVLALFAAASFRVLPSANRTITAFQNLKYGRSILNTVSHDLSLPVREYGPSKTQNRLLPKGIELNQVSYKFEGTIEPTLNCINLKISAGESIGIIGTSGAGKSTLIDVFMGLLEPNSGQVLVDGEDISIDPRIWQSAVGYVPQNIFLTDESLQRNIAFGVDFEDIDKQAVDQAIDSAQLRAFVNSLPEGLNTVVGERGVRLSGGQRQRIGIARALYQNPPVLILDEATSSLDLETEAGVMEAVEQLHGEKTLIIVAHRLSTVQQCDRLFLIDNGKVAMEGSYEEVIAVYRPTDQAS